MTFNKTQTSPHGVSSKTASGRSTLGRQVGVGQGTRRIFSPKRRGGRRWRIHQEGQGGWGTKEGKRGTASDSGKTDWQVWGQNGLDVGTG